MLNLCINHKDVAILVNQHVTRNKVPYLIGTIRETPFLGSLLKTESGHVGIYHNLCGWTGIGNAWLDNDWLNRAAIKASKTIEGISSVREKKVVQQNLFEQRCYTAAVQKIVDFIYNVICNISVILISARPRNTQVENVHHGNLIVADFSHLFSSTLLCLKTTYICLAISKLRFMYCAKSLELIGDCCDAAIFRILRSVASLWNWLRYVMTHLCLEFHRGKDTTI